MEKEIINETEKGISTGNVSNSSQITKYIDFKRVNFSLPGTISLYGEDVLKKSEVIVNNIASMIGEDESIDAEFERRVAEQKMFATRLRAIETEKDKLAASVAKRPNSKGLIRRALNRIEVKKIPSTYDLYQTFKDNENYIKNAIESKRNNVIIRIRTYEAFSHELTQYIDQVERLIEVGIADKDEYVKTVIAELEQKYAATKNEDDSRALVMNKQYVELFEERLYALRNHFEMMKITKQQNGFHQVTNYKLLVKLDEYLKTVSKTLRVQSISMLTTANQRTELATVGRLFDSINTTIRDNQEMIEENISASNELSGKGTISIETLEELNAGIIKCVELYKAGVETAKQQREANIILMDKMAKEMETLKKDIIIDLPEGIVGGFVEGNRALYTPTKKEEKQEGILSKILGK